LQVIDLERADALGFKPSLVGTMGLPRTRASAKSSLPKTEIASATHSATRKLVIAVGWAALRKRLRDGGKGR
jgi:hypothetical protein